MAGDKNSHYGLGWRLITTQNNNIVYHGGLVNGFRTEIAFDKEKDIGVVFFLIHYVDSATELFLPF